MTAAYSLIHKASDRLPSKLDAQPQLGFITVEVLDSAGTAPALARFDLLQQTFVSLSDSRVEVPVDYWRIPEEQWVFWYYDSFPYVLGGKVGPDPHNRKVKEGHVYVPSYGFFLQARATLRGEKGREAKAALEQLREEQRRALNAVGAEYRTKLQVLATHYDLLDAVNMDFSSETPRRRE